MTVYVDIVWLTNFVLDLGMLLVVAKVRKTYISMWRIVLAAAIGASYVLLMFVPSLAFLYSFTLKCLFSIFMIMTAFKFNTWTGLMGTVITFYVVHATTAGTILAMHALFQSTHEVWSGVMFSQTGGALHAIGGSLTFIVASAGLGVLGLRTVLHGAQRRVTKMSYLAEVEVQLDEHDLQCIGLIDTGNHLYDPLTRIPVMVMEAELWSEVLPAEWLLKLRTNTVENMLQHLDTFPWMDRIRMIPYKGIQGQLQLMIAVKPDRVTIHQGALRMDTSRVLIGLSSAKLSSEGTYQAIIHPDLIPS
jgi:stage II sporulation protein GA (sporulation sigma-E factor processing peptidase)